ncbi:hypothetical protein [Actinoalloteichus caeruleus]|uniref:hypothetical protein n=1 Tax=Actinoalloteichus cyanogriseus TaxID=2893586 RepID=UPI003AB09E1B
MATYRGMWADFAAAGRTSDWQDPALTVHATGLALQTLTRGLYADAYNEVVRRGEPVLTPEVWSVEPPEDPRQVIVTDCGDGSEWLAYTEAGEPVDEPAGRRRINAIVERQDGGEWKVSDFGVHGVGTC